MVDINFKPKIQNNNDSVVDNLSKDYVPKNSKLPVTNEIKDTLQKKEAEKTKKEIQQFSDEARKKYSFIESVGIVSVNVSKYIEEEFEISDDNKKRNLIHLCVILPEKKSKELESIKIELIKIAHKINDKLWIHLFTPNDFWELGLDSKFEVLEAFSMSYPIYDKGILASLRITSIHKSLVLRKFEKYVTTYAIGGSFVRGDTKKTSDVDVFVIIDDTDVKRMRRLELLEKLRGIIYSYIGEALAIGGAKVDLNVQVYLLTDFWESVKDAHPVMFTFIRDGIPLYDRGAFLPWKSLLKRGRIKPTPEAIDMFMGTGDKMKEVINKKMLDIVLSDLYWGTINPTQGLLMLYGLAPQNVYDTVKAFRDIFVKKEKLIEKKYADVLEEITIKYYKGYEHGKIKSGDIDGKTLDKLFLNVKDFLVRLKELRIQIDDKIQQKEIKDIYNNLFGMLGALLNKKEEKLILKEFNTQFVKKGKFPQKYLDHLKFIVNVKNDILNNKKEIKEHDKKEAEFAKKRRDVEKARRRASVVTNALIEFNERCDFLSMDRSRFILRNDKNKLNVFFLKNTFIVEGNKISKIVNGKMIESNPDELDKQILDQKGKDHKIDLDTLQFLKKKYKDFELIY